MKYLKPKIYLAIIFLFLIINTTAAAESTITVDGDGKGDYTSIQQAVNNSVDGDTILVNKGIYVENVIVDKKLAIISKSENPKDTIVQALNPGDHVFHITANNVTIKGFGLKNSSSGSGIYLDDVQYNTIANNHLQANNIGLHLWHANNNMLINNTASDNSWAGIRLSPSDSELASNNTLINNTMINNLYNFAIDIAEYRNASMKNDIDTTNTVNGKTIYYLVNVSNISLNSASNAGTIYCINCQNISIKDQILEKNFLSIYLRNTSNSKFDSNIISNNYFGIIMDNSNNNSGSNSIVTDNIVGILIASSANNNLSNNVANFNGNGFDVQESTTTELNNNTANFNEDVGIAFSSSIQNKINGNIANYNGDGIKLFNCSNNLLNNNVANSNRDVGIDLGGSRDNTLTDNIANLNRRYDFELAGSNNSTLRDNIGNSDTDHLPNDSPDRISNNEIKNRNTENKSFIGSLISKVVSWIDSNNSQDSVSNNSISNFLGNISEDSINIYVHPGDSIQQAIDNSNSGDIIAVYPGLYKENLVVDKSLVIISKPGESTETMIQAADPEKDIFHVAADNVTISGFNVTGTSKAGIYYTGSDGIIAGNKLVSDEHGIFLEKAKNITVENNNVTQNGCGIYLSDSSRNILENNEANDNSLGIHLDNSTDNQLSLNTANSNNKYAAYLKDSHKNWLESNNLSNIEVVHGRNGLCIENSSNNKLTDNSVSKSWEGVYLKNSSENELNKNRISANYFSISIENSNNNKFLNNIIESNIYEHSITLGKSHNNTLQGNSAGFMTEIKVFYTYDSTNNTLEGKQYTENAQHTGGVFRVK